MHELYKLERTALDGYATYNFAKGMCIFLFFGHTRADTPRIVVNSLSNFANITLSALYFDITKDCLYADSTESLERRRIVTVLQHV